MLCVCKHAVRSGYNHESKGLKNEQTDLPELQYLFFFSSLLFFIFYFPFFFFFKPLLFFELMHQKVSLRLQDVLSLCLWSSANILPPRLFPSKSRSCLDLCDDRVAGFRMCRFGFLSAYMLSVFVCGSGRKSVFHLEILMFHVSLSKMCREEGQVLCSKDFFFFTRFWYHVAWS